MLPRSNVDDVVDPFPEPSRCTLHRTLNDPAATLILLLLLLLRDFSLARLHQHLRSDVL